jgi:hypothetical protein
LITSSKCLWFITHLFTAVWHCKNRTVWHHKDRSAVGSIARRTTKSEWMFLSMCM